MTVALIVVGVVAYLTAYFAIGWTLAKRDLPHLWERARGRRHSKGVIASEVNSGTVLTLLFWPLRMPFIFAARAATRFDPEVIEAERREQERRIAELERELRIGRRQ
jgi:hypothetical protein